MTGMWISMATSCSEGTGKEEEEEALPSTGIEHEELSLKDDHEG